VAIHAARNSRLMAGNSLTRSCCNIAATIIPDSILLVYNLSLGFGG
jgi:hypothetical protein